MDQYIIDTEYAVENLIHLITIDEKQLFQYQNQCETAKEKEKYFYQQFIDSQFNDDVVTMQEQAKYVAWCQTNEETRKRLTELQEQIRLLQMSINSKSYSISTLCGTVLQIAKQGISIVHNDLNNCPDGKNIGLENLKNVIWQGRNQSMHYEEGKFSQAVRDCFFNLEISFGNRFSLNLNGGQNLAHDVIEILDWKDYSIYQSDLKTLLMKN
jgi:hypothetical protein